MDDNITVAGIGILMFGVLLLVNFTPPNTEFSFSLASQQGNNTTLHLSSSSGSNFSIGVYPIYEGPAIGEQGYQKPYYYFEASNYTRDISSISHENPDSRMTAKLSSPPDAVWIEDTYYDWSILPASALTNMSNHTILLTEPIMLQTSNSDVNLSIISYKPFSGYVVVNGRILTVGGPS
jgi:hypothetical protein